MPVSCNIVLDNNPARVYYAGQLLSGHVELSLSEAQIVRGIYVEISGKGYCHWSEGKNKSYTGRETYLEERTYFVGASEGEITAEPGHYNYDFHCNLPGGLPTSLEAQTGHIRYTVRVVLDIPRWPDKEFEVVFTVIKPLDLNYDSAMRLPVFAEKKKVFYPCCICCCCPSNPMHIMVRIPVGGYTPGQTIDIEIDGDNKSKVDAEFSVRLMKEVIFYTHANSSKTRTEFTMVCEKEQVGVSRKNSFEAIRTSLVIPPIPPTDDAPSNICKVRYIVRVFGAVNRFHINPFVDVPITIGSYPIVDHSNMTTKFASYAVDAQQPLHHDVQQPLLLPPPGLHASTVHPAPGEVFRLTSFLPKVVRRTLDRVH